MAQVTETVARGILAGHGYTDNEVRQLAHHWLATHGQAPAQPWIERWYGSGGKDGYEGWSIVNKGDRDLVAYLGRNVDPDAVTQIVMTHNATLTTPSPQAAQQAPAEVRRSDLVPGVMHCAKCKFQLNRVTLCVSDGNAYAGDNKTEPCPNGCGPLWPVTWEQEARNCWKTLEEMHERLQAAQQAPAGATVRHLEAVIKGAADKLDAAVRCHPNAVDALVHEALEILDGDREPYCTPTPQAADTGATAEPYGWLYDWTHSSATGRPDTTYTGFTKDEAHARKHDNCIAVFTTQQPAPATQQAGEPAFWMNEKGHTWSHSDWKQFPKHRAKYPIPLYPHFPEPQPSPTAQAADPDGEAFRTAARLGLTLRFYGGCAQSSMPGTPSAYEVVTGSDRAAAMREAVERAGAVIASGGESQRLGGAAQAAESVPALQGETNAQLDTDSNHSAPGQQRDVARSVALGQPMGHGPNQVAGHLGAQGDKLLTVAERNIRSFLRSAHFKSESDREAALNCVDVLWEAVRAPADSVLEDAERYRWLRERSSTMFVNISINGEGAEIAETLDSAVDAARKQGGSHD